MTACIPQQTRRPRVYAARPADCFGSPWDSRTLAAIERAFPGAWVADPAVMFADSAEWRRLWPDVLAGLDLLVVYGRSARRAEVGAGVLGEVADVLAAGRQVAALDRSARLAQLAGVEFAPRPWADPRRVAALLLGAPLEAGTAWLETERA